MSAEALIKDSYLKRRSHIYNSPLIQCLVIEPCINKYAYHLRDDTKYDPILVDESFGRYILKEKR